MDVSSPDSFRGRVDLEVSRRLHVLASRREHLERELQAVCVAVSELEGKDSVIL